GTHLVGYPVGVGPRSWAATGRGAAWLARLTGGQKVAGSNPAGPTDGYERGDPGGLRQPGADGPQRDLRAPDRADPRLRVADRRRGHDHGRPHHVRVRRRDRLGRWD